MTLVSGTCNLAVDGTTIGSSQTMGEDQPAATASNHPFPEGGTMALTALSGILPAGVHTVEVACLEERRGSRLVSDEPDRGAGR